MWGKFCFAFVVAVIGGMTLLITEVDAQSTVDDSESSAFIEAADLIKEGFLNVKFLLASYQKDLKAACASNQQQCPQKELSDSKQALLCEYRTRIIRFP